MKRKWIVELKDGRKILIETTTPSPRERDVVREVKRRLAEQGIAWHDVKDWEKFKQ